MAQNQIAITSGVTTHEDVLNGMNANFADSETRLTDLETDQIPQVINVASALTFDQTLGYNAIATMVGDCPGFQLNNPTSGDNGLFVFEPNPSGWIFNPNVGTAAVMGNPADVALCTGANDHINMGYFYDGTKILMYFSDIYTA